IFFFFFSSRRRHTRSKRDWSSDVCSSDLVFQIPTAFSAGFMKDPPAQGTAVSSPPNEQEGGLFATERIRPIGGKTAPLGSKEGRSEERRVGKEWRVGWCRDR